MKTKTLLASTLVLLLSGCGSGIEEKTKLIQELDLKCQEPLSITILFSIWGSDVTVQCRSITSKKDEN